MPGPDLEKMLFRLNVFVVAAVFTLTAPSTRIFASWYPDRPDLLWFFPLAVLGLSIAIWIAARLSIPLLIRLAIFPDRREAPRKRDMPGFERFWRMFFPAAGLAGQMLILIFLCLCMIAFMRTETLEHLLKNLP